MSGTLYLCATPIGNLEDMTLRVIRLMKECDLIAAEDTRQTLKLLNHFQIDTPTTSYHEHNKMSKGKMLIEKLKDGKNIVLVSDAGMPGISDPGEDLCKLCYENDIPVTVAPGASAVLTAVVLSGLSSRRFIFEAFLPSDKKDRKEVIASLEKETRTVVFYEAPHRIAQTLEELYNILGDRQCACIRELTKRFEEVKKGTLSELFQFYKENPTKGEFVIVLEGASKQQLRQDEITSWESISIEEHMDIYMKKDLSQKDAMKQVAKDRGVSKREIYSYLNKD